MFFKQLIEDYDFDDIKYVFENDKYFLYSSGKYSLSDKDEENFNILKNSEAKPKKYSLEVITMRKPGVLSRAEIIDHEDEFKNIKDVELEELAAYPVDMTYSSNQRRGIQLIISVLLEHSFYIELDSDSGRKKSTEKEDSAKTKIKTK